MTSIRAAICLSLPITIALIFGGCSSAASSSGDLDIRTGCAIVTATPTMVGAQVVTDVTASGCRGAERRPLPRDVAVDRVARDVWRSLRLPVDAIQVRTPPSVGSLDGPATVLTSEQLENRYGPGPSGVVWPARERGTGDRIWFLLPLAYAVSGLGIVWLARCMVRAGVVVLYFRR